MEELQDAIEDAQYVNAIATQEEGPRPVLPWDKPTEEQMAAWEEGKKPHLGTLDWTLSSPIGLFLFSSYLKEKCDDYVRINFCEEVLRFKKLQGRARFDKAVAIVKHFLAPIEELRERAERRKAERTNGEIDAVESILPPRTLINEYDMERTIPKQQTTKEEVERLMVVNMDYPECSSTVIGVKGPVWKELVTTFKQIKDLQKMGFRNSSARDVRFFTSTASAPLVPNASFGREWAGIARGPDMEAAAKVVANAHEKLKEGASLASNSGEETSTEEGPSSSLSMKSASAPTDGTETVKSPERVSPAKDLPKPASEAPQPTEQHPLWEFKKNQSIADDEPTPMKGMTQRWLRSTAHQPNVPVTIFDQAERVVMESLYREYWQSFLESEEYAKFKNFMWYQDRRVVPEDFFVMRVLGRGGFGLVTGKLCFRVLLLPRSRI